MLLVITFTHRLQIISLSFGSKVGVQANYMHHVTLGEHPTNREYEKLKPSAYSMSVVSNCQCSVFVLHIL